MLLDNRGAIRAYVTKWKGIRYVWGVSRDVGGATLEIRDGKLIVQAPVTKREMLTFPGVQHVKE